MSAVAAPKTFQQVRNFLCITVGLWGFMSGQLERDRNNTLWLNHQMNSWKANGERIAAAHAASHPAADVPAIIPAELHDTYKALTSGGH